MLMLNFYPSAGTPAGDCEGHRLFVRVPDDDLSRQVMSFPVPAWFRGNPSVSCTQPTSLEVFCTAPQPGRSTRTSVYDHRFHQVIHPNKWDDIDQWFRKNLTYETDEMFQPYIQGHLWLTPRCRDSPDGSYEPYGLGRSAGLTRWYAARLGFGRPA